MKHMRWKKIFVNTDKSRYCIVRLYDDKERMQTEYMKLESDSSDGKILGAHLGWERYTVKPDGSQILHPQTGVVFLCANHCPASVAGHELMHAVLWGWKHKEGAVDVQHPITIASMEEEEELLHNFSFACQQFYDWFWSVVVEVKGTVYLQK